MGDQALWWALAGRGALAFAGNAPLSEQRPPGWPAPAASPALPAPAAGSPPKLAYLIVAHHQPAHLARLVRALDQPGSHFFIHIDSQADIAPFRASLPPGDHIIFIANRVAVEWGRFSVVQATLNALQAAVGAGVDFRYYTLLSGSDYPIKHKRQIAGRLRASQVQWLRIDRQLSRAPANSHAQLLRDLPEGRYFGAPTLYHGSMYWSLTAGCVRFIVDFIEDNPGYVDIHRHIIAPDEVFFHTIVRHSPFAGAISHDFADGGYTDHVHHGNHYIDWAGIRPRQNLILDEPDLEDLLRCDALFARKFDENRSSRLLQMLDEQVHGLPVWG